jgi:hypothetical protein
LYALLPRTRKDISMLNETFLPIKPEAKPCLKTMTL